jgi:hypothetical protein
MSALLYLTSLFIFNPVSDTHSGHELRWGQIGHYVTGEIAEKYLTEQAAREVRRVLGNTSLAMASTWMDDIRSDSRYDHTSDWHWVTIPPGKTYEEAEKNPNGDIIEALERKIAQLKEGGLSEHEEWEKLKMVIHMVGDIHQPLHVGTGEDRGGNDVRVRWMGENSNLHRVWDSDMINSYQLSFTELTRKINHPAEEQIARWQQATVRDWAMESKSYRDQVYDLPDNRRIGWEYRYKYFDIVEKRLLQAGIRLAGVINDIYGE